MKTQKNIRFISKNPGTRKSAISQGLSSYNSPQLKDSHACPLATIVARLDKVRYSADMTLGSVRAAPSKGAGARGEGGGLTEVRVRLQGAGQGEYERRNVGYLKFGHYLCDFVVIKDVSFQILV